MDILIWKICVVCEELNATLFKCQISLELVLRINLSDERIKTCCIRYPCLLTPERSKYHFMVEKKQKREESSCLLGRKLTKVQIRASDWAFRRSNPMIMFYYISLLPKFPVQNYILSVSGLSRDPVVRNIPNFSLTGLLINWQDWKLFLSQVSNTLVSEASNKVHATPHFPSLF